MHIIFADDCSFAEFQCDNTVCVRVTAECNGRVDCTDGSDEHQNCTCKNQSLTTKYSVKSSFAHVQL